MKTAPLVHARIDFSDPAAPGAPDFGDVYHSRAGALGQARHVFLGGNGLPGRWAGRERFVMLETGFGLGNNFLAAWDAWRQDPARCRHLLYIGIEKHPARRDDLQRAHAASPLPDLAAQLVAAWPPLTPDLHALDFENGGIRLLLAQGDVHRWMRELVADDVDAFCLDGFSPAQNPDMWDGHLLKALGRRAAPDATAATWSVAPQVRAGLAAAGFEVERQRGFANKGGMCVAQYRPRHIAQRPAARAPLAPGAREALIIGAGLAGAACAWALAREGIASTVIDTRPGPAQGASGNPAGLFHGTLNPDDGLHARFNRAAALATERALRELPPMPGLQRGLLRLEQERDAAAMQALIDRLGLPPDYVQALDRDAARAASGLPGLPSPAWFYPGGGALTPSAYARAMLDAANTRWRQARVGALRRAGDGWQVLADDGSTIGEAPLVVIAAGHEGQALLDGLPPLLCQRGQLTHLARSAVPPRIPVAGLGYAIPDGTGGLWCGAASHDGDMQPALRSEDQAANLAQWSRLSGEPQASETPLAGRVAWRLAAPDRLPLVGGLPDGTAGTAARMDQPRFIPRLPGLAVCTAFGSRGITWAALCGQVLAAQVTGAPLPLEASLVDAIDPARFLVRQQRRTAE
ncbi:FAD-dependent 5-carboxymethylaminomethyl-2-thiouridine(34) oxidoreductase MnmC [Paucibacter sp. R3-3]|uniref:tRNA 5-methylaminomethyl-2-thiouridine biosynthesis bifunctional protein MnmC n=1 Tax=Roseateles agri TaxID=3098619 RepID=A0ABU5DIN3_9BURK|nr:FAD-dependent 5-carboxymethylaminomethyl-2-thiouridine(34) oxidoreductase MnmC [Paucibacter sp. R3-3]MDY0746150.1 FAD-dependent 5-carboxymethylaminomethyl-2-thiouridine(34) oxidoreductase MnmC [Paucibacter sp. R3-3]